MSVNIKQNGLLTPIAGMDDQINDSTASSTTTYSSNKINTLLGGKADTSSLATVATSGSYSDLINKPDLQIESKFISAYGNVGRDADTVLDNALCYASVNTPPTSIGGYSDGSMSLITQRRNNSWTAQIAQRYDTGEMFVRGQASGTWSSWKKVAIDVYLDQTATLSTTDPTTYTFTDARITADSVIDVYADIFGVYPSSVVASAGTCTVTFPKQDTAQSMTCRIYIK